MNRPPLEVIKDFIKSPKLYEVDKYTDDARLQQINLLRKTAEKKVINEAVLLGASTYIAETIRKTYKRLSPFYQAGYIKSTGSRLFTNIENKLKEWNQDSDDKRFINLMNFYQYVQAKRDVEIENEFGSTKETLMLNIENRLRRVRKRENTRVSILTNSLPDLELFQLRVRKLLSEYKSAIEKRKWWEYTNPNRMRFLEFNEFIMNTWKIYQKKMQDDLPQVDLNIKDPEELKAAIKKREEKQKENYQKARDILTGSILYILLRIKGEYKCLSPEGSYVFDQCLKLIGLKSLDDMSAEIKERKLCALAAYLQEIKTDEKYTTHITNAKSIFDFDKYITTIYEYITAEGKKKNTTKASRNIATVVAYGVQLGTSYALTALGGIALTCVTGGLGAAVYAAYTATGTFLISMLGQLFYDNCVPDAVSGLYTYMLNKIGTGIATITVGAFDKTFHALYHHKNLKDEDRDFLKEWIYNLLIAPESVVSDEEKDAIRYTIGPNLLNEIEGTVPVAAFKNR